MSRLEDRYRRLLGVLPAWYRERREDEMVGTFLADRDDELDLEYGWPGWGEAWAVAVLAVRTRLAAPGGPPRAVAIGDAVRLVALLGLVAHAAGSLTTLARSWLMGRAGIPGLPDTAVAAGWVRPLAVAAVAVAALAALVLGRPMTAKVLAVAGLGYALIVLGWRLYEGVPWSSALVDLPLLVATGCLLVGFHGEAPAPGRGWLRALLGAAVVMVSWTALVVPPLLDGWAAGEALRPPVFDSWERFLLGVDPLVAPPLAVIVAGVVLVVRANATWAVAFAVSAFVLLPGHLAYLGAVSLTEARLGGFAVQYVVMLGLAIGLTVVGVVLAVLATRGVRRLPSPTHPGIAV